MTTGQFITTYKQAHPDSSAQEISEAARKKFPGSKCSPASVSSTLSRAGMATGRIAAIATAPSEMPAHSEEETETDARTRINKKYAALGRFSGRIVGRKMPSLIVSGPPGMQKGWTMLDAIRAANLRRHDGLTNVGGGGPGEYTWNEEDSEGETVERSMITDGWYDHISGSCSGVGLFHAAWNMRKGGLIVLDDVDAVFRDEDALNLLKIMTDSTKERLCSWRKHASWLDEYQIDKTFDFQGHVAFLTNVDFEEVIRKGHRDSEHFKAMIDRAAYLCLTLRSARDFMIRIKDVGDCLHKDDEPCVRQACILKREFGLGKADRTEVLGHIDEIKERFYNLSIRLLMEAGRAYIEDRATWKDDLEAIKVRTLR